MPEDFAPELEKQCLTNGGAQEQYRHRLKLGQKRHGQQQRDSDKERRAVGEVRGAWQHYPQETRER